MYRKPFRGGLWISGELDIDDSDGAACWLAAGELDTADMSRAVYSEPFESFPDFMLHGALSQPSVIRVVVP